ncbi:MAG TPA: TIGR03936 family radical SAM-associated protein, partial [Anaerolineales bacterium]
MRLRITFAKTEEMRYTGHLDLHRTWERIFRRAGLPLAYSQGYHPQPRINLAAALPLGFTSQAEIADIWLEESLPLEQISKVLNQALPPGLQLIGIQDVPTTLPSLQTQVAAAEYSVKLLDPIDQLDDRLQEILNAVSLPRERRSKSYDLRPLILGLERQPNDPQGRPCLCMRLAAEEGATGRPEEVLAAL